MKSHIHRPKPDLPWPQVLFSHSCSESSHVLHRDLSPLFEHERVGLQLDPFARGEDVVVAMERMEIHGLVFFATAASASSQACKTELDRGRELEIPMFVIRDSGASIPDDLKRRIYVNYSTPPPPDIAAQFSSLACTVAPRARLYRSITLFREPARPADELEELAKEFAWQADGQVLAEFRQALVALYRRDLDPSVLYMLSTALARTSHRDVCDPLRHWLTEATHPYARLGIKEALATLDRVATPL